MDDVINLLVIVLGIGIGMLAIWLDFRRKKLVHDERMEALRQGIAPPDWLIDAERKEKSPAQRSKRYFIIGGILLLVGLWLFLGLIAMGMPTWIGFWASLPGWIGAGLIVAGFIVRPRPSGGDK